MLVPLATELTAPPDPLPLSSPPSEPDALAAIAMAQHVGHSPTL